MKNVVFWKKIIVDIKGKIGYNIRANLNGGAMVSTGILRHDKRGETGNLDKGLKIKK